MKQQNLLILVRAEEPDELDGWRSAFGRPIHVEALGAHTWALTITAGVL